MKIDNGYDNDHSLLPDDPPDEEEEPTTETSYVYAKHCTRAGQAVPTAEIEARGTSDDWEWVELTEEEAKWYEDNLGSYGRQVASEIRRLMNTA